MKSICTEKRRTVPEQVEVVNEANVVDSAGRLKPGAQTEDSGEMPSSTAKSWQRSAEPEILSFPQMFRKLKRPLKSSLVSSDCRRAMSLVPT